MYIDLCIFIYIYPHLCICIDICTYARTHTRCMNIDLCTFMYVYSLVCIYVTTGVAIASSGASAVDYDGVYR